MGCRCHSSDLYASLVDCPACGHRSYDRLAESCERRRCAYEGPLEQATDRPRDGRGGGEDPHASEPEKPRVSLARTPAGFRTDGGAT